jgi:tetratricopeptide (TPR) repeat protein
MTDEFGHGVSSAESRPGAGAPSRVRSPRRASRLGEDRVNRALLVAVLALMAAVLGLVAWMLVAGFFRPQAPRTAAERSLFAAEAQLKASPKDVKSWGIFVSALVESRRYSDARAAVRRGEAAIGAQPVFLIAEARMSLAGGDWKKCVALSAEAAKLGATLRKKSVDELAARGVTTNSKAFYAQEIIAAEVLAAEALSANGRLQEAVAAYGRALSESPVMADVLTARGDLYLQLKRYDEARADYTKALEFGPDYAPALTGLKKIEAEEGQ